MVFVVVRHGSFVPFDWVGLFVPFVYVEWFAVFVESFDAVLEFSVEVAEEQFHLLDACPLVVCPVGTLEVCF